MTFKETEFPVLIRFLKSFINEETDPILIKDVTLQLIKLYEECPLYPGIVNMCLGKVVKTLPAKDVQVGQKVYIRNRTDVYVGTVSGKDDDGVTLKGVKQLTTEDELEVGYKEMERVTVINDQVLQEMWPSLVFEKGKKA